MTFVRTEKKVNEKYLDLMNTLYAYIHRINNQEWIIQTTWLATLFEGYTYQEVLKSIPWKKSVHFYLWLGNIYLISSTDIDNAFFFYKHKMMKYDNKILHVKSFKQNTCISFSLKIWSFLVKKKAFHITERLKNNLFLKSKKSLKSL